MLTKSISLNTSIRTTDEIVRFYLKVEKSTGKRHADYMCPARMNEILRYCHQHPATSEQAKDKIAAYFNAQMLNLQHHEN